MKKYSLYLFLKFNYKKKKKVKYFKSYNKTILYLSQNYVN